tara:strand:+ start:1838 stop:2107 length:270 start_codon:yes stop_codon:yes gene_type:complete
MYNNGINNDFEKAHDKGLRRGFDLGWSYKGRFDRQIIQDIIEELEEKRVKANTTRQKMNIKMQIFSLTKALNILENHPNNRENITLNSW